MSQIGNFSKFYIPNYNIEQGNNYFLNNEYTNISQPLINIQNFNNIQLKNNGPIYINNITINNEQSKNNQINEYSNLSYNYNKKDENNYSKLSNKKKRGETIDFKTKWKTEKCHYWDMYKECKFGESCAFAHGDEELKQKNISDNYKTKLCKQFFEDGFCLYGSRCQFSHKKRSFDFNNLYNDINNNEKYINYSEIISNLLVNEKININIIKRPRLMAFENIVNSTPKQIEENRFKLYLDVISLKNKILNQNIAYSFNL